MTAPRRPDDWPRDPVLDAAWNAHSSELPPARVDAAILAAAHREAKARPQALGDDDGSTHAPRPARAWWGLAAAATIGAIAFGVIQLAPPLQKSDPMVASDVPPSASSPSPAPLQRESAAPVAEAPPAIPTPAPPSGRGAMSRAEQPTAPAQQAAGSGAEPPRTTAKRARADDTRATQDQGPSASQGTRPQSEPRVAAMAPPPPAETQSPRPFPATPPPAAAEGSPPAGIAPAPADAAKAETSNALSARRIAPPERAAAMVAPQAQRDAGSQPLAKMRTLTPEAWIERIRLLHAQQRLDEAALELNAFRETYPDADSRLPSSLAAWAAGVKRTP